MSMVMSIQDDASLYKDVEPWNLPRLSRGIYYVVDVLLEGRSLTTTDSLGM